MQPAHVAVETRLPFTSLARNHLKPVMQGYYNEIPPSTTNSISGGLHWLWSIVLPIQAEIVRCRVLTLVYYHLSRFQGSRTFWSRQSAFRAPRDIDLVRETVGSSKYPSSKLT